MHPTLRETVTFLETLQFRKKNYWCYFGMEIVTPVAFYFTYRYCSELLRGIGFTTMEIMLHNVPLGILQVLSTLGLGALALVCEPFKILKMRGVIGLIFLPFAFLLLATYQTPTSIFIVQLLAALFWGLSVLPALVKIVQAFPIIGRCTNLGSAYAISHAMMYVVTAYGTFFLDQAFGIWGVGALFMMAALISLISTYHFQVLTPSIPITSGEEMLKFQIV